ncbi:hypothetical protein C5S31_09110 [ANME-1 cluster archaeon GoMg2]|nr:hypothetical protein [ANME-1 cluster archaeon GoMg2]
MKPFSTIAIPHRDILEGRLTMDVFAANLWEVYKGRAHEDYRDSNIFFRKTYFTEGLNNLLDIAEQRLKGEGGDPIIQLQTPFGGGKTHSLIALYHKAKEWGVNVVVIDGSALGPKEIPLWEEIELQLTGKVEKLKGRTSPGGETLRELFAPHQPLLILMDEILEYVIAASGIKVEDSTLASQVLTFVRRLTDTVRTLDKTILIHTYPSRSHYAEHDQKLLNQLQERSGRMEKIYTPVHDEEIYPVIRRRLFSSVNEAEARETIAEFLEYAEREKMLPEGVEKSSYRERYMKSYPFQPDVIDVLYKRWGSFPDFQRTRGVLRLLSLVVYAMRESKNPFITLADFDLSNGMIKGELLRYIGPEYNSVIAQDITSNDAGAKKVDKSLGDAYIPFSFGIKTATSIFMYSFSGGPERGGTINEIKLASADVSTPSSIIVEAISKLKEHLFYIQTDGKLFFTNQPNLNRVLLTKMENITDEELKVTEKTLLTNHLKREHFETFLWPGNSKDIPDTKSLKLIIEQSQKGEKCKELLENYGERPRVYRNTPIFLYPINSERINFKSFLKRKLAWQLVEGDKNIGLTFEQRREVKEKIKKAENEVKEFLRNLYRIVLLPSKDKFTEIDLGIPTYGAETTIDREIYERLRSEGQILEKLAPLSLREKYLKDKDRVYVETKNILESFFKTPGEIRIVSDEVLKTCIKEGVKQGLFGLGDVEEGKTICRHFKVECTPELTEGEILIRADLCTPPEKEEYKSEDDVIPTKKGIGDGVKKEEYGKKYRTIHLKLGVPTGKLSEIVRVIPFIKSMFKTVNVKVEISAVNGEMSVSDYEDKIMEAIKQAEVEIEGERLDK